MTFCLRSLASTQLVNSYSLIVSSLVVTLEDYHVCDEAVKRVRCSSYAMPQSNAPTRVARVQAGMNP
jgi:hypothetical protein